MLEVVLRIVVSLAVIAIVVFVPYIAGRLVLGTPEEKDFGTLVGYWFFGIIILIVFALVIGMIGCVGYILYSQVAPFIIDFITMTFINKG
jgi:hypothetical protein